MPDARGNFKGISLSGKAAEVLDRIRAAEDPPPEKKTPPKTKGPR